MRKRILKKKAKKWIDWVTANKIPLAFRREAERKGYVRAWARMYVGQKHTFPKPWWREESHE